MSAAATVDVEVAAFRNSLGMELVRLQDTLTEFYGRTLSNMIAQLMMKSQFNSTLNSTWEASFEDSSQSVGHLWQAVNTNQSTALGTPSGSFDLDAGVPSSRQAMPGQEFQRCGEPPPLRPRSLYRTCDKERSFLSLGSLGNIDEHPCMEGSHSERLETSPRISVELASSSRSARADSPPHSTPRSDRMHPASSSSGQFTPLSNTVGGAERGCSREGPGLPARVGLESPSGYAMDYSGYSSFFGGFDSRSGGESPPRLREEAFVTAQGSSDENGLVRTGSKRSKGSSSQRNVELDLMDHIGTRRSSKHHPVTTTDSTLSRMIRATSSRTQSSVGMMMGDCREQRAVDRWEKFVVCLTAPVDGCRPGSVTEKGSGMVLKCLATWEQQDDNLQGAAEADDFWLQLLRTKRLREARVHTHESMELGREYVSEDSFFQRLVMRPHGVTRVLLGLAGATLIMCDVLLFPIQMVFPSFDPAWLRGVGYFSLIYWTIDIPLTFITGFHVGGVVELRLGPIAKNYLHTWFLPDVVIVVVEWAFLLASLVGSTTSMSDTTGVLRLTRLQRTTRVLRILRIARLWKLKSFAMDVLDNCRSEGMAVIVRLMGHVLSIMLINHYIACSFLYLGLLTKDSGGFSWLCHYEEEQYKLGIFEITDAERYTAALHWTLTQFTPATNDTHPVNYAERIWACCVVMFAMVTFSSFVSSITGEMSQLRNLNSEMNGEEARLRDFFTRKRISLRLEKCIWSYFRQHYRFKQQITHEQDIKFFREIPESMLIAMHREFYLRTLLIHPLFANAVRVDARLLDTLCHKSMRNSTFRSGQDVFVEGSPASGMFVIEIGRVEYITPLYKRSLQLGETCWISEMALWTRWAHRGLLRATEHLDLIEIVAQSLQEAVVIMDPAVTRSLKKYVTAYLTYYNNGRRPATDVLADQSEYQAIEAMAFDSFQDMMMSEDTTQKMNRGRSGGGVGRINALRLGGIKRYSN